MQKATFCKTMMTNENVLIPLPGTCKCLFHQDVPFQLLGWAQTSIFRSIRWTYAFCPPPHPRIFCFYKFTVQICHLVSCSPLKSCEASVFALMDVLPWSLSYKNSIKIPGSIVSFCFSSTPVVDWLIWTHPQFFIDGEEEGECIS